MQGIPTERVEPTAKNFPTSVGTGQETLLTSIRDPEHETSVGRRNPPGGSDIHKRDKHPTSAQMRITRTTGWLYLQGSVLAEP